MVVRANFGKKKELINKRQNLINEQACYKRINSISL